MDSVAYVKKCFDDSEQFMDTEFERLRKLYQLYRAVPDTAHYKIATRSQYVVPLIYKTVETVLPRIISVLLSASPPIVSGFRIQNSDPNAYLQLRALDQLFEYHFDQKNLYWVIQAWIKESLIYGQSYLKVGWKQRKRTVELKDHYTDEQGILQERMMPKTSIVEDAVDVQNVDVFDLFFPREAYFPFPFETSKHVIHRIRKRKSLVLQDRDNGLYLDFDDQALSPSGDQQTPAQQKTEDLDRSTGEDNRGDDPMITLYEMWEDEKVTTTAEHRILLREEANPYGLPGRAKKKPFVACVDNLVYGLLWQIGEAEPLEHTQIEMSTLRRQRTDNNSLIINKMWLYHKDADVDLESLALARPGGAVGARPTDNNLNNAVVPIPQQEINGTSYKEFEDLDKDGQEISGLLDYAVGSAPERRETATTVQLLQTAANARFDIKVRNYAQSFQELGYMMFERWKQLLDIPIPLMIPQQTGVGFIPVQVNKNLLPDYDAINLSVPGSPGLLLKDARQQKLLQFYESLRQNPFANPMASLQMLIIALKEADIDGIEPILQMLQTPMPPPMPPGNGNGAKPSLPSQPVRPQGPGQTPQVNEFPLMSPMPQGSR